MLRALIAAALAGAPVGAAAEVVPFLHAQQGYGVTVWGVGARIGPERTLWKGGAWRIDHDFNVRLSRWLSHREQRRAFALWEVGAWNTLRFLAPRPDYTPFAEAGLAMHLLTHTRIGDRALGTAFQFGQHVALGVRFGPGQAYTIAARMEHVSNADIKKPNDGVSMAGFEFRYAWR